MGTKASILFSIEDRVAHRYNPNMKGTVTNIEDPNIVWVLWDGRSLDDVVPAGFIKKIPYEVATT